MRLLGGGFRLVDEKGLPLEVVVSLLHDRGYMLDWLDFYDTAVKRGWKFDRTFLGLFNAVLDVYGKDFCDNWVQEFQRLRPEVSGCKR